MNRMPTSPRSSDLKAFRSTYPTRTRMLRFGSMAGGAWCAGRCPRKIRPKGQVGGQLGEWLRRRAGESLGQTSMSASEPLTDLLVDTHAIRCDSLQLQGWPTRIEPVFAAISCFLQVTETAIAGNLEFAGISGRFVQNMYTHVVCTWNGTRRFAFLRHSMVHELSM
jgi:hypothetical protein